jgi:hypothetical protein
MSFHMANPACSPPTFGKRGEDRILGLSSPYVS